MEQYVHWESPGEAEKEKEEESVFKHIMTKNFPNLGKEIDKQIQEVKYPK